MPAITLDGEWKLYYFPEGSQPCTIPADLDNLDIPSLDAQVPGNVELDLVRAGRLSDPFVGRNIHLLRAFESFEWWYVRQFTLPKHPAVPGWELVFDGLDLLADVWVNGKKIGQSANMLVPHHFLLSTELAWGAENSIAVHLSSALNQARRQKYEPQDMSWEQRWEGLRLRKAPHVWGWDILPRAVGRF
jgi:beta-mannosidase